MNTQREIPNLNEATERVRLFEGAVEISRLAVPLMIDDGERIRSTRNPLEILDLIRNGIDAAQEMNAHVAVEERPAHTSERKLWELGVLASGKTMSHSPYFVR
jgi:hypothetical protein